jgi:hypothetical protein
MEKVSDMMSIAPHSPLFSSQKLMQNDFFLIVAVLLENMAELRDRIKELFALIPEMAA